MNDTVEYVELVCDANLREIEIVVNVPFNGELTMCYARGVYNDDGLIEVRVTTWDDYEDIYHDALSGLTDFNHRDFDEEYVEQIVELLDKQL